MANMSNYLEQQILNHLFRGTAYTAPTKLYIALCTDTLDDDATGASLPEVTADGYERKSIDSNAGSWTAPDEEGIVKNVDEIKWDKVTWEATIKAIAICDDGPDPLQGNVLFWGALTKEKVVTEDDSVSFAEEALSIQIDN
jgi:hypothetical protein